VSEALRGGRGTVICYGHKQSGKTHTSESLLKLALGELFAKTKLSSQLFTIKASFVEVHESDVTDVTGKLKGGALPRMKLRKEDKDDGFYVQNLIEKPMASFSDFERWLKNASSRRSTAHRVMAIDTTRAHSIVKLTIEAESNPNYLGALPLPCLSFAMRMS
jgi:hypothetical protein